MAFIQDFTISGLAGRRDDISQALNRDLNIFFGLNGSGKTSLLKILHSAMSGNVEILTNVPFSRATVTVFSESSKRDFTLTIEKNKKRQEPGDIEYVIHDDVTGQIIRPRRVQATWQSRPKRKEPLSWSHRYLPISRIYEGAASARPQVYGRPISDEALNDYFASSVSDLWRRYTSGLLGAVRKAQEDGLANILKDILDTIPHADAIGTLEPQVAYDRVHRFLKRRNAESVLTKLEAFEHQYSTEPRMRRIVSDINAIEEKIDKVMEARDKLSDLTNGMFGGGKKVAFNDRDIEVLSSDQVSINLAALSSGEKQVLRLFIEDLLAESNSIIIDEPELSMHIDWQRGFVDSMRRLNQHSQLILATHSPEIMANVDDGKIFQI